MMRTAPNPEGPWSREVQALRRWRRFPARSPIDDAQAHPEYNVNGGQTMFVTYSRSTGAFTSEFRLVSVQLQQPARRTKRRRHDPRRRTSCMLGRL